jgi:hypothetical protein
MLRSTESMSIHMGYGIEMWASTCFYIVYKLNFSNYHFSDLLMFHLYEEIEHGMVTV